MSASTSTPHAHDDHRGHDVAEESPDDAASYWERRYADAGRMWSGRVNAVLEDVATGLEPGSALDLGCGEGGDVLWLARRGWRVTGVDLSPTAVERARAAAMDAGLDALVDVVAADLAVWDAPLRVDLVTASFLQSWPVGIPRDDILRRATRFVAPGGRLLVTAHAAPPSWADPEAVRDHPFPSPEEDLAALRLDPEAWTVERCGLRERTAVGPDGVEGRLVDGVVLVRRSGGA